MFEVGEYVRTKNGIIDRIKTINRYGTVTKYDDKEDKISIAINYYINSGLEVNKDDIVKHSKHIIDLVQVGDYVNGHKIIMDLKQSRKHYGTIDCFVTAKDYTFEENEIETILTKEQYMKNCYKVDTN